LPRLSVVIVTFNSSAAVRQGLPALAAQLGDGDELIVADNASRDGTPEAVEALVPSARVIRRPVNDGFASACDEAAATATGDLLVFLNPDTVPAEGFAEAIRLPLEDERGWSAWMGLVTMHGGRAVNTSGGVVHFTGVSWAGQVGEPVEAATARPREVGFASGACLAVPRSTWNAAGGFPPDFFMYCEDVDLSLRLRLEGGRIGVEPSARVDHEYEFEKGSLKWRMLERNRLATVVRTYPGPLLALVAPALLVTELALHATAARGGWWPQKALATADLVRAAPRLVRERREIQARRTVGAGEFARSLTADLSSPYLGGVARLGFVRGALAAYWRLVLAFLGAGGRSRR
jgi:GT2 family glycosyltransferase